MTAATTSTWARRYVFAGGLFLVASTAGTLAASPRTTTVRLALFGFVLHTVFGKAYSLVPSYFDRELAFSRAPAVQFPFVSVGAAALAAAPVAGAPGWTETVGAASWCLGVAVFLGALFWTIRTNLSGRETATGETKRDRRPVDRLANAFVPVALGYLAVGTYALAAPHLGLPPLVDGYPPRATHLLAAGTAGMLVFALGFRLLPRFLVASPPRALVAVVLVAGAVGPALLATNLLGGPWFRVGAVAQATAVVGFAVSYAVLYRRSDRRRVGFYGVLVGAACGVVGVSLGLSFAFGRVTAGLVTAHLRFNLLGFLGVTIVGIAYQFYPPAVGRFPGSSDRTALAAIACLGGGLAVQLAGLVGQVPPLTTLGELATLVGATLHVFSIGSVFARR